MLSEANHLRSRSVPVVSLTAFLFLFHIACCLSEPRPWPPALFPIFFVNPLGPKYFLAPSFHKPKIFGQYACELFRFDKIDIEAKFTQKTAPSAVFFLCS